LLGETIGRSLYDRLNDVASIEAGVSFQLSAVESKSSQLCVLSFPIRFRSTFLACQRRRCHMSTVLEKNTGSDNYSISCHHMTMRYEE